MKETYTREEAAKALGCSLRTVDRLIPVGTPGRHKATPPYRDPADGDGVTIDRSVVEALLPAPGGDDNAQ